MVLGLSPALLSALHAPAHGPHLPARGSHLRLVSSTHWRVTPLRRVVSLALSSTVLLSCCSCLLVLCYFPIVFLLFFSLLSMIFFFFFVRYFLLTYLWFDQLVVTKSLLVPLSSSVLALGSDSASSASTSFRWLMLFPCRGSNKFVLICTFFASVTALCGPLRWSGQLFDQFSTICMYFYSILFCVWSVIRKPTTFLVLWSSTLSSLNYKLILLVSKLIQRSLWLA
jgi:hypothetical protein